MKNSMFRKSLVLGTIILLLGILVGPAVSSIKIENEHIIIPIAGKDQEISNFKGYENINADEAWDFLSDTGNGIQIPIDVRYESEWYFEHMDTPVPENPRFFCLCLLQNPEMLDQFITLYDGLEIIVYCKTGGRSAAASQLLADSSFTGTIYNMVGGITSWKTKGYPTTTEGFLDIAVGEAWELLNNTNNAFQKPIDVRTYEEWIDEHIDTPPPENASHYPLSDLQDPEKLWDFMDTYKGMEIIFYCNSGDLSLIAAEILVDNSFEGTIYNMLGGMDAWKDAGYPTVLEEEEKEPDLECSGLLNWTDVPPGSTVNAMLEITNVGEPDSLLDWEIESYPDWGDWTFDPSNGTDLPTNVIFQVFVNVTAPDDPNAEFTGEVKIVNMENSSDFYTIPVYLKTPKNQQSNQQNSQSSSQQSMNPLFLKILLYLKSCFI